MLFNKRPQNHKSKSVEEKLLLPKANPPPSPFEQIVFEKFVDMFSLLKSHFIIKAMKINKIIHKDSNLRDKNERHNFLSLLHTNDTTWLSKTIKYFEN